MNAEHERREGSLRRFLSSKWVWLVVGLFLVYSLAGFFLAPRLIQQQLANYVARELGRDMTLGAVQLNPWTLSLKLSDARLHDRDGSVLFGFEQLLVNFEAVSLTRWAWSFREIGLSKPEIHIKVDSDGTLNLAQLAPADAAAVEPPAADSEPTRPPPLIIERLWIDDGRVSVTDNSRATPAEAAVGPFDLEFADLTTLPHREGPYQFVATTPEGAVLEWRGEVTLQPLRSEGHLVLRRFPPAVAWRFARDEILLEEPSGQADFETDYRFAVDRGVPALTLADFRLGASDLTLVRRGESRPMLKLAHAGLRDGRFDLASRSVFVGEARIDRGHVLTSLGREGQLNWGLLRATAEEPAAVTDAAANLSADAEGADASADPWHVEVATLFVDGLAVTHEDHSAATPFVAELGRINLSLNANLTQAGDGVGGRIGDIKLKLSDIAITPFDGKTSPVQLGELQVNGEELDLASRTLAVNKVRLADGQVVLRVAPNGRLNIGDLAPSPGETSTPTSVQADADATPWGVVIDDIWVDDVGVSFHDRGRSPATGIGIDRVDMRFRAQAARTAEALAAGIEDLRIWATGIKGEQLEEPVPLFIVPRTVLRGGAFDLASRQVTIAALQLTDGRVETWLDEDGVVNWVRLTGEAGMAAGGVRDLHKEGKEEGAPWAVTVDAIDLNGFGAGVADRRLDSPSVLNLEDVRLGLRQVSTNPDTPLNFNLAAKVREGGQIAANGEVYSSRPSVDAAVTIDGLALKPVQPYLQAVARLSMDSGAASLDGKLGYGLDAPDALRFTGELVVDDLTVTESSTKETLIGWKQLGTRGFEVTMTPDKVAAEEVVLTRPIGKFVINPDQTTNWQDALIAAPAGEGAQKTEAASAPSERFPVEIARVTVKNGSLDFADLSLRPEFSAKIHQLNGAVAGVSTASDARTSAELSGRVEEYGSAKIRGELEPFDPTNFAEVSMAFRNVEMNDLTPYTIKFAGRRLDSGKMDVDLDYRIKRKKLDGNNKFVLNRMRLGEKVESPGAMDLPLDLAIALLEDANGRIDIGLPVSGDLENPEFSYGHLIWQALGTFFTKLVASPFSALGAALGVDRTDLDTVAFEAGRREVPPPEEEKLKILADALQQRPQLGVEVHGTYDPAADGTALKSLAVRQELAQRIGIRLEPGQEPGPVAFSDAKTQKALEKMYKAQVSRAALRELKSSGQAGEKTELARQMFEGLVESAPLDEKLLTQLAVARTEAVVRTLTEKGGVAPQRVKGVAPSTVEAATEEKGAQTALASADETAEQAAAAEAKDAGSAARPSTVPTKLGLLTKK